MILNGGMLMTNLIELDYPREVNLFRKVVHDKEQFNKWWASLDNASDAYMTVYGFRQLKAPNYRRGDYQTAIVRHFVLDFDCTSIVGGKRIDVPLSVPFDEVKRLHQYLIDEDITHGVWFSGGGFHVWVKLAKVHSPRTGMESSILKGAGRWLVRQWAEHLKLNCIDPTVTFDLASLIRVPNSYSVKRQLWSIPLTTEEILNCTDEEVQALAKKHRSGYFQYGANGVELDLENRPTIALTGMLNDTTDIPTIKMDGVAILPCLQASSCRKGSNPTHDARYHLASYLAARLRNFAPPQTQPHNEDKHIAQIVDFISTLEWVDYKREITHERVAHIVRGPYGHTPCWSLFNRGYCVGKCHLWDGTGTIPNLNNTKEVKQ